MATVKAPKTETMDEINLKSIVSFERLGANVTFRNRAGEDVGTFPIRIPNYMLIPCIKKIGSFDLGYRDVLVKGWHRPFSDTVKLADPSVLPPGIVKDVSWSPDSVYLGVAHDSNPYFTIYKRSYDTLTKIPDPLFIPGGTLPSSYGSSLDWSPDGQYLATAVTQSPYIVVYSRSGDTFTKLPDPSILPPDFANYVSWSPDGVYLVVGHSLTPYFTIYKRSGTTLTKLANPASLPTGGVQYVSWSPDGQYISLSSLGSPWFLIYKRSGDTFTKLPNPDVLPPATTYKSSWSPDGTYLSVAHNSSPYVTIYKRSGDTFTKLPNPAVLPTGAGRGTSWTADSKYLAVAHTVSPFMTVYYRVGDTFTKLPNPLTLPASNGQNNEFSPEAKYLAVGNSSVAPYLSIYKSAQAPIAGLATRME